MSKETKREWCSIQDGWQCSKRSGHYCYQAKTYDINTRNSIEKEG